MTPIACLALLVAMLLLWLTWNLLVWRLVGLMVAALVQIVLWTDDRGWLRARTAAAALGAWFCSLAKHIPEDE